MIKVRETLALRKVNERRERDKRGRAPRNMRGAGRRDRNGHVQQLHGPMDYAKTLKLRFRVGDMDVPD